MRDITGISTRHASMLLGHLQVTGKTIALLDSPTSTMLHHRAHLTYGKLTHARTTYTRGQVIIQFICELIDFSTHLVPQQVGSQQPYATVDVEANATGRYDTIIGMSRCYTTNRKTITPVNIRHCQRRAYNPRQCRHIRYLVQRIILKDLSYKFIVGIDQSRHTHLFVVALRNTPAICVYAL